MKYVMFEHTVAGLTRKVPIIFPDELVHKFVAEAIANHREYREFGLKVVSAGQCAIECSGIFGESETLKLKSNQTDGLVINSYDYLHGL
jgi:hypothetical protein